MPQISRSVSLFVALVLLPGLASAIVIDDFEVGQLNSDGSLPPGVAGIIENTEGHTSTWEQQVGLPADHVASGEREVVVDIVGGFPNYAQARLDPDGPGGVDDALTFRQSANSRAHVMLIDYVFSTPIDLTDGWQDRLAITVSDAPNANAFKVWFSSGTGTSTVTVPFAGPGVYELPFGAFPGVDPSSATHLSLRMENPITWGETEPTDYAFADIRTGALSASETFITFEGYKTGEGIPSPGGAVASNATGPEAPWGNVRAYVNLDGWNARSAGDHAGEGTEARGWTSLDNENPGAYALHFEGYQFDHTAYDEDPGSPRFGHEDRWYDGTGGTWTILRKIGGETWRMVATGTLDDLHLDIDYGLVSGEPGITGEGIFIAADDGGAFYDELMGRFGTPMLEFSFNVDEPPNQAENPNDPLADQWAIFGGQMTLSPIPEPSTLVLLIVGAVGFLVCALRGRK